MTKLDLILEINTQTGIDKKDVQLTIETFFKVIKTSLLQGQPVHFRGFGSFVNKKKARKVARNLAKNTAIIIDAHCVPSFKPAKEFITEIKEKVQIT